MSQFEALHLQVIEMPVEFEKNRPIYRGYLREIPTITGEAHSKQALYRQLVEQYQVYFEQRQTQRLEEEKEEMTSALLHYEDLIKYYDGESFDGFEWREKEE